MSLKILYLLVLILIPILFDSLLISKWKIYKRSLKENTDKKTARAGFLKHVFITEPQQWWLNSRSARFIKKMKLHLWFEVFVLALWAMYIGIEFLNMDPRIIPAGGEFASAIVSNHMWTQAQDCGWCALWNGSQRGGFPAFADIQGSMLHPVVILTTLIFGVVNGAKVTIVASFWLAGVAQWWIARELKLGWMPRMWSAGIAIAGGHMAGRMELGVYGVVLSTAAASLVIAAMIRLARENTRRNAIVVGVLSAAVIVSGQGYAQVGLIGLLPIYLFFYRGDGNRIATWSNYLVAAAIAVFLAAPLLVPLLNFSPNVIKWFDPEFKAAQPLSYSILNLVINDPDYYYSSSMAKLPYPHLYTLYIGWIPVLLFGFALSRISPGEKKLIGFMIAGIIMEFLIASAIILKWLVVIFPPIAGVRHSSQVSVLAIPLILGISAYGLEKLLAIRLSIPGKAISERSTHWAISTHWLMAIPLILSLGSCMKFSALWMDTTYLTDNLFQTLEEIKTPSLQWVSPPVGEHIYLESAIAMGLKISPGNLPWDWKNRIPPSPQIIAKRTDLIYNSLQVIEDVTKLKFEKDDKNEYAIIETSEDIILCQASGTGGWIEVLCETDKPGTLIVQENTWTGWNVWVDGEKQELIEGRWLGTTAPAGKHIFTFRYQPQDVPFGLILFTIGIFLCGWFWISKEKGGEEEQQ